jgi:hypothetical protein
MITVKAYNWDESLARAVARLRRQEVKSILSAQRFKAANLTMCGLAWLGLRNGGI